MGVLKRTFACLDLIKYEGGRKWTTFLYSSECGREQRICLPIKFDSLNFQISNLSGLTRCQKIKTLSKRPKADPLFVVTLTRVIRSVSISPLPSNNYLQHIQLLKQKRHRFLLRDPVSVVKTAYLSMIFISPLLPLGRTTSPETSRMK